MLWILRDHIIWFIWFGKGFSFNFWLKNRDLLTLFPIFYDLAFSRNLYSKAEISRQREPTNKTLSGTDGLIRLFSVQAALAKTREEDGVPSCDEILRAFVCPLLGRLVTPLSGQVRNGQDPENSASRLYHLFRQAINFKFLFKKSNNCYYRHFIAGYNKNAFQRAW